METIPRYSCLGRDAPVPCFVPPGNFREGVGVVLSYSYESRGRDSFKGGRFVTPQKSGYRFLCCYSLPTFPSRKISPGYRLTTGKIQMMLGLATSSPAFVASHDPFPLPFAREYARMLPRSVRCVAYQPNSIDRRLMELNPGKFLDTSSGCVN